MTSLNISRGWKKDERSTKEPRRWTLGIGCMVLLAVALALWRAPVEAEFPRCDTEQACLRPASFPGEDQALPACNTACTYSDGGATTCGAAGYNCTNGNEGSGGGGGSGGDGGDCQGSDCGRLPAYGEWLKGSVWQSSTAWGGDARRAVDGNQDGNYASGSVTHTDINVRPEWHIYTSRTLYKSVTIYNRTDCCGERLGGASVWVRHWDEKSGTFIWRRVEYIPKTGEAPGGEAREARSHQLLWQAAQPQRRRPGDHAPRGIESAAQPGGGCAVGLRRPGSVLRGVI